MSLLMDALKRAEKARQAEASSDGAEMDPASTQGFTLDPIDRPMEPAPRTPQEPAREEREYGAREEPDAPSARAESPLPSTEFTLEDESDEDSRLAFEPEEDEARERPSDVAPDAEEGSIPDQPLSLAEDESAIPEDTSATLPSLKSAKRSVENYFDGTGAGTGSLTVDDLRSALAEEDARREGEPAADTDTQRRVRAVFHAKEVGRARRNRSWVVLALVPLLFIGIIGLGAFVFWDMLSDAFFGRPDLVARSAPPPPPTGAAPTLAAADSGGAPAATATAGGSGRPPEGGASTGGDGGRGGPSDRVEGVVSPAAGATGAAATVAAGTAPDAGAATDESSEERELMAAAPAVDEVLRSAPAASPGASPAPDSSAGGAAAPASTRAATRTAQEKVAQRIEESGLGAEKLGRGSPVRIRRKSTPDRLHPQLESAYDALRAGDYAEARREYERVHESDPRNRDAHLGLAAIAVREQRWRDAANHYVDILRTNPRDSVAQASLIAIQENIDPLRSESRIKLLLREEPQAPHLHFTLGNLFAEQGRWSEAQQAYFNAHRLDSANADYAYNLAVSLDQLAKRASALDYYRRALELGGNSQVAFERTAVEQRIRTMTQSDN